MPLNHETHESTTDPAARLARKSYGQEAKLTHSMHVLMSNRGGLIANVAVSDAGGRAERREARTMITRLRVRHRIHVRVPGPEKAYDDGRFLGNMERRGIEPMVPARNGAIVGKNERAGARLRACERERAPRFKLLQIARRRIEPILGWLKNIAGLMRTRFVGRWKTQLHLCAASTCYNVIRLAKMELV